MVKWNQSISKSILISLYIHEYVCIYLWMCAYVNVETYMYNVFWLILELKVSAHQDASIILPGMMAVEKVEACSS